VVRGALKKPTWYLVPVGNVDQPVAVGLKRTTHHAPRTTFLTYRPLNSGFRFSTKAVIASVRSSERRKAAFHTAT
jgi:hypothetical protein